MPDRPERPRLFWGLDFSCAKFSPFFDHSGSTYLLESKLIASSYRHHRVLQFQMGDSESEAWQRARERYLRMGPVETVLEPLTSFLSFSPSGESEPLLSSVESQDHFVVHIVRDSVAQQYPPSAKYTAKLLKSVLDFLGSKYELSETLLELYFEYSNAKPTVDGLMRTVVHKTWTLKPKNSELVDQVTIRMADQLDSVGLTSWQAGFMFADFAIANRALFDDKICLELGSGVGLTGIVLAKLAQPAQLLLTDYTTEVLNNMRTNLEINNVPKVLVQQLDWELFENDKFNDSDLCTPLPDVIFAADCVYDTVLVEKLCVVLKWFLSRPKTGQKPVAYIATTLRNPKTFQYFQDQLAHNRLVHEDVTSSVAMEDLFEQPHTGIILSRIVCACEQ